MNVLFICNGNICRSPLAAALLKKKYKQKGIKGTVSSAGFESYNINEGPNKEALMIAEKHSIKLDHKARIFMKSDFRRFDRIFVMDTRNFRDVKDLAKTESDLNKVDYLMNVLEPGSNKTIPDPFQSGVIDIEYVFDILDRATDKIVEMALKN
jgi:protein-tyrosine phosphatase